MKPGSIFWVVDYIKAHRDKETRYTIDTYLLRLGYDAGTIEDAWQIAGFDLKSKSPPFYKWLFLWGIICNFLSWAAIVFAPWQSAADKLVHPAYFTEFYEVAFNWAITPIWVFLPVVFWTAVNILLFSPAPTITFIKTALIGKLIFISLGLAFDLIVIIMASSKLTWQGPVLLTLFLVIAWVCSFIELIYIPRKIEVVLPAHSSN